MASVKIILGCPDCGRRFSYVHDAAGEPEDQFCPYCGEPESAGAGMDFASNRAPITFSNKTRAVEHIWKQAQDHHGLTDMRDNLREGDIAAPPLTKDQQVMSDVWDAAKKPNQMITPTMVAGQNMGAAGATNFFDVARAQTAADRAAGIGDPLVPVLGALRKQGKHHHGTDLMTLPKARRR